MPVAHWSEDNDMQLCRRLLLYIARALMRPKTRKGRVTHKTRKERVRNAIHKFQEVSKRNAKVFQRKFAETVMVDVTVGGCADGRGGGADGRGGGADGGKYGGADG